MIDQEFQDLIHENNAPFTVDEFLDGRFHLKKKAVQELIAWRIWTGYKMQITSAWRLSGSHRLGKSFDVLIWDEWRKTQPTPAHLWRLATTWPWMGVGIYFDWDDGIGLHVDVVTPNKRQRPLRWMRIDGVYYYQNLKDGLFYSKKSRDVLSSYVVFNQWKDKRKG